MTAQTDRQKLLDALVEILDDLDASARRSVRTRPDRRIDDSRPTLPGMVRAETEGETVDVTDRGPYTLASEYSTFRDSSATCPQSLSPYRVRREKRLNGDGTLHGSFLGDAIDPPTVACGNCGVLPDESTTVSPHRGEELSHDETV